MKKKRLLILLGVVLFILLTTVVPYLVTYNHPIIIGDEDLVEKFRDDAILYSHVLMPSVLGIPTHAQLINIVSDGGSTVNVKIYLISLLPYWKVTVWDSESDVPYWEHWLHH